MTGGPKDARVLVVDDDEALANFVVEVVRDAGYSCDLATRVNTAKERITTAPWDVVVTDIRMPGESGLDLIVWAKQYDPRIAVLAITAYGSVQTAVQAVRLGAADYIPKPFDADTLLLALDKCLRERSMRVELARLKLELDQNFGFESLVATSAAMRDVVGLARRVADSPSTILLGGPSGSGKEALARAIHRASPRRAQPFVAVNCAAIPESLLESELFGHKRGSFTGAHADKPGLFAAASGGTLLLDEVGDIPVHLQAKLLRALQEREVRPVGAQRSEPIDVRLIAASHHDLRAAIATKRFREDLYYRLCVIEIVLPPLAARVEDILPLSDRFLHEANQRLGRSVSGFSGAAKQLLCNHAWPGNVRELQNVVERAVNLCSGDVVTPDDLPAALRRPREEDFLDVAVERKWSIADLEVAYARRVLAMTGGNKKAAAQKLGIDRRTLQRWLGEREEPGGPDEGATSSTSAGDPQESPVD